MAQVTGIACKIDGAAEKCSNSSAVVMELP